MEIKSELIKHNFRRGRSRPIDLIVIHVMEGDLPDNIKNPYTWFQNPEANVSAHYGVSREDEPVRRWVKDEDQAFHAGKKVRPTSALVKSRPGVNPNEYSIGIENEGSGREKPTHIQIINNVELIRRISRENGFPIDRYHVVGHNEIRADKDCPGLINVDELVSIARGVNGVFSSSSRVLKKGDRGGEVEMLQVLLVRLGYMTQTEMNTGPGIFGNKTNRAFKNFLKAHSEE